MALPVFLNEAKENGGSPARDAAFARVAELGIPNRRVEGWKWSDFHAGLRGFAANDAAETVIAPSPFAARNLAEIVIVNGVVETPATPPAGLRIEARTPSNMTPSEEAHPFGAVAAALAENVIVVSATEGAPALAIRHIATGARAADRIMIDVAAGAEFTLIESFEGAGAFAASSLTISAGDGATVRRFLLQEADDDAIIHGLAAVTLGSAARFEQVAISGGTKLCRHELQLGYVGTGGEAHLSSAALLGGARHNDVTTLIRHDGVGAVTRQTHKGVAAGRARNVFQGKFYVGRGGQKTDAQMAANALLLSDGAEANHKPELEIYADDVECAHGSTCGALDDDALFYLRQRGLSEHEARALLIEAFVGEVVEAIEDEGVRAVFAERVASWMKAL